MPQPFYLFVDHKLLGLQVEAFVNFGFDFHSHYSCMFVCVCFCMGVRRHWRSRRRARGKFRTLENIMTSSNDDFARYSQPPPPRSFSSQVFPCENRREDSQKDESWGKWGGGGGHVTG